jgi:hypothetical protein
MAVKILESKRGNDCTLVVVDGPWKAGNRIVCEVRMTRQDLGELTQNIADCLLQPLEQEETQRN